MCDFFDDFEDDFDYGDFMYEDSFEDSHEGEMGEAFDEESDHIDEPEDAESRDDEFTVKDAFIMGAAIGLSYEEGKRNKKRKKP